MHLVVHAYNFLAIFSPLAEYIHTIRHIYTLLTVLVLWTHTVTTQLQAPLVFIGTEMDSRQIEMGSVVVQCACWPGQIFLPQDPGIVRFVQPNGWAGVMTVVINCNLKQKYLFPNLLMSQRSLNMLHRVALIDENTNMANDSASCCAAGPLLVSTLNVIGGQRCRFPCPLWFSQHEAMDCNTPTRQSYSNSPAKPCTPNSISVHLLATHTQSIEMDKLTRRIFPPFYAVHHMVC